jgi:hypothetical protein
MKVPYINNPMRWLLGLSALVVLGTILRWILRIDAVESPRLSGLSPLGPERDAIFQPISQEIETQTAILGISLNDAIEERDAGQLDIAWRLVRLSASEWDRLAEIVGLLSVAMSRHMGSARTVIPVRRVPADRFKSRVMADYVRMHELFDQLVFRTRLRFQLHLRMLRRAAEILSREFRRDYRYADRTEDRPPEIWERFDYYFHDFDLVVKETLLSCRTLLACLPHSSLPDFATDLKSVVRRGVRSTAMTSGR